MTNARKFRSFLLFLLISVTFTPNSVADPPIFDDYFTYYDSTWTNEVGYVFYYCDGSIDSGGTTSSRRYWRHGLCEEWFGGFEKCQELQGGFWREVPCPW